MKIQRSSKIYFNRWLTNHKKSILKTILNEYSRVSNFVIQKYINTELSKFSLAIKKYFDACKQETGTWFSSRMLQQVFFEAYGMIKAYQNSKNKRKSIPKHNGKKMSLSISIIFIQEIKNMKHFDLNIHLHSLGNKKFNIDIPLHKHRQFNKLSERGKLAKSIILTKDYVQFIFKIETGTKKESGKHIGVDIGLNNLVVTSENKYVGTNLKQKISELHNKQQYSKAYKRKKIEIKEYINLELKALDWDSTNLIVCENLKNVKYKMKFKRRLNKSIRRFISNWNYRYVLDRIQMLSEDNRVSFRSVSPFYTSQTCSSCGYRDKRNRVSQEKFKCQKCNHTDNADFNASKNILDRFLTGKYGSCFKLDFC